MSIFHKKKNNHDAVRQFKNNMQKLSEAERDFVVLLLDGGRTAAQLRRRGFNANEMAKIVASKGFTVLSDKKFDPTFIINKEF